MSTNQNNGKKSSSSSIVNTPSSTPLTSIANGNMQTSPTTNNNAPKYGTLVPNRIFVGGISANTTEGELMQLFSNYGTVKAAKIIQDRAGVSKGYGFITFENEDDAKRPLREAENIVLRERKLNIAPAIKKQPFSRAFDASSPSGVPGNTAQFFFPPGAAVPYFQGGVAYYPQPAPAAPADLNSQQPVYQPPPVYPAQTGPPQPATYPSMMFPTQTIYMPQQYPMPMPYEYNYYQSNGAPPPSSQYVTGGGQNGPSPANSQCPTSLSSSVPDVSRAPPCYNQQLPTFNHNDTMFYNFAIYEGAPVYSEAFELGAAATYTEDYNQPEVDMTKLNETPPQHPPPLPPPLPSIQTAPLPPPPVNLSHLLPTNNHNNNHQDVSKDNSRNSNTPVVSLLSIDQQQEKDYSSMQGGRRRKTNVPMQQNHVQIYPSNGYGPGPFAYPHHPQPSYNGAYNNYRRVNGYDNRVFKNRRRNFNNNNNINSNDHSSRSSLRTDSNSSASCVDENNRIEDSNNKNHVRTPPPAPYSPMTPQYKIIAYNNNNNNSASRNQNFYYARQQNNNYKTNNDPFNHPRSNPQVHVPPPPPPPIQNSLPPQQPQQQQQRRNRRSQGRQQQQLQQQQRGSCSTVNNEIGAGDAPLPAGEEVVTKRMESLKL